VDKPPVLLGYQHESGKKSSRDGDMEVGVGETNSTYMSLFVTVQPPLTPAEPVREKVIISLYICNILSYFFGSFSTEKCTVVFSLFGNNVAVIFLLEPFHK
jgi:hypothetical protein